MEKKLFAFWHPEVLDLYLVRYNKQNIIRLETWKPLSLFLLTLRIFAL